MIATEAVPELTVTEEIAIVKKQIRIEQQYFNVATDQETKILYLKSITA